ncbi:TatD family hydrolase [Shewanella sedimentimangrovi]|uniref:TatD family hydrolase n=1 Tax=Shewanella sedimentimangrovi TaxID=2814293 RepID=A0ABX7R0R1_9GAMM|nr:TatD family hydrolase [Shewanella sedimentimangrovi]QSX36892.1 TatD family hydrolase [Shewanella sedimentimangrovi]
MSSYLDVAVNLLGSSLEPDLVSVIREAEAVGVSPLLVIGSTLDESEAAIQTCALYPGKLYCTAGVHPHHANQWNNQSENRLRQLSQAPQVVAVGEAGLDYNRDFSPRADQRRAFEAQLALAAELGKPVLLHQRDAHSDFIAILSQYRSALPGALLHCFTGNRAELQDCLALDLHLGITGWICDERRGLELAELVKEIPANRLLLETDSPYLLPRSMRPKPKSGKNLPKYLPYIAVEVARLRGESETELAANCYRNSLAFFNLEPGHA